MWWDKQYRSRSSLLGHCHNISNYYFYIQRVSGVSTGTFLDQRKEGKRKTDAAILHIKRKLVRN
jgi:hypothetical protein